MKSTQSWTVRISLTVYLYKMPWNMLALRRLFPQTNINYRPQVPKLAAPFLPYLFSLQQSEVSVLFISVNTTSIGFFGCFILLTTRVMQYSRTAPIWDEMLDTDSMPRRMKTPPGRASAKNDFIFIVRNKMFRYRWHHNKANQKELLQHDLMASSNETHWA